MPYLPTLSGTNRNVEMVNVFNGYNKNLDAQENEFDDMKNISSSFFPVFSPRKNRGTLTVLDNPNGLIAKSNLFWVDGTTLYYNGVAVSGLVLQDNPKQFVSMGAYLLIWPDKVYFNTDDQTHGSLEASITIAGSVTVTLTKQDGTSYGTPTVSSSEPADQADGALWIDTSDTTHVLKQYSGSSNTWIPIPTTYVKIAAENIGKQFNKFDGVTISGLSDGSLNGDFILYGVSDNEIIVTGMIDTTINQTGGVTVQRKVPDMDYLTEEGNRVWGCSSENHEIYACKLGDPFNWNYFMGLSTDSYAAKIGSDGDFTAACTHLGQVLFFKEDILHKVSGNKPANYVTTQVLCRGVEKGSEKSLAAVNERLYYKSRTAICMYDGALPMEVSGSLGDVRYTNAVAGSLGNKYYVSMMDTGQPQKAHIFVYDEARGLWHKEDNTQASYFAIHEGELFYIDAATKKIMTVGGRLSVHEGGVKYDAMNGAAEPDFEWYAQTGDIGMSLPGHKYVSRLNLRMGINTVEPVKVSVQYDSSGVWEEHTVITTQQKHNTLIPIIPRRCDHMKLRLSGVGDVKVYSITKTIEGGGD